MGTLERIAGRCVVLEFELSPDIAVIKAGQSAVNTLTAGVAADGQAPLRWQWLENCEGIRE